MSENPDSRFAVNRRLAGTSRAPSSGVQPRHHISEEILDAYVAGACERPSALAIACHLTLCGACRARMRLLEDLAGVGLETGTPAKMDPGAWEGVLGKLDVAVGGGDGGGGNTHDESRVGVPSVEPPPVPDFLLDCGLPRPLLRALAESGEPMRWRFLAPGVQFIGLTDPASRASGSATRLLKLRPGLEIPLHDHGGPEYTVIFTGALEDSGTLFSRGDVVVRMPGQRHVQCVDKQGDCVALQINEGPLKALTWKGHLLNLVAGGR